jgi:hypothetical protein
MGKGKNVKKRKGAAAPADGAGVDVAAAQKDAVDAAAAEAAAMGGDDAEEDEDEEEEEQQQQEPPVAQAAKDRSAITDQNKEIARLRELTARLETQLAEVLSHSYPFNFISYLIILMAEGGNAEGGNAGHPCLRRKAQEEAHRLTPDPASGFARGK